MILFIDFDGVLHPNEVYLTKKGPRLHARGELFMWAPLLSSLLNDHPEISIVLSTSWVRHLGFYRARSYLPMEIQEQVIGATWHSQMARDWADQNWWDQASRYAQIQKYVGRANIRQWIAVDDDAEGWNVQEMQRLVLTEGNLGLSQHSALRMLGNRLSIQ